MSTHADPFPDWRRDMIAALRRDAYALRLAADRQEALARRIECPPEGVSVERGPSDTMRFVRPEKTITRVQP